MRKGIEERKARMDDSEGGENSTFNIELSTSKVGAGAEGAAGRLWIENRAAADESGAVTSVDFEVGHSSFSWRRTLARVLAEICKPVNGLRTGANSDPPDHEPERKNS